MRAAHATIPSSPPRRSASLAPPAGVLAHPNVVYEAATRCQLGQAIRTLPSEVQQGFIARLEGIVLPDREKHRLRFLNEIAGLAARVLEPGRLATERAAGLLSLPGYLEGMVREDLAAIDETFGWIRDIAVVCMRSSTPADYVRLLSRPGVDIRRFLSTMPFFAGDRSVRFTRLDMRRRKKALDMERLARSGTREAARALLSHVVDELPPIQHGTPETLSDWKILHAFDIAAVMMTHPNALVSVLRADHRTLVCDKVFFQLQEMIDRVAVAKQSEALVKHTHDFLIKCGIYRTRSGYMLRFGKTFRVDPIEGYVVLQPESLRRFGYAALTTADIDDATALLACEDERTVQHELQHVFDKITYVESALPSRYRGERGEHVMWMETRSRLAEMAFCASLESVEDSLREARENAAMANLIERDEMRARIEADRIVCSKIGRLHSPEAIRRAARRLLDQAYRQAYGLAYTRIIEPFLPTRMNGVHGVVELGKAG